MNLRRACLLLLPLAFALPSFAQTDDEMITDRPDQSESSAVVGRGVFQLETGIDFERDESPGLVEENIEWLSTLVRWGISDSIELRLAFAAHSEYKIELADRQFKDEGFGDPELGVKWRLREGDGLSPAVALLAATTLPIGEDELSSDHFDPTVRIAFDHDLTDSIGLGWNVGYTRDGAEDQDYALYSGSLGVSVDERWGVFYELFGTVALGGEGGDSHSFDSGVTCMLNDDLQLDVYAGLGLTSESPDGFVGIGISWRSH